MLALASNVGVIAPLTADETDEELPFGFIEASPMLQQVAKTRGFFSLGFSRQLFYNLKPLE